MLEKDRALMALVRYISRYTRSLPVERVSGQTAQAHGQEGKEAGASAGFGVLPCMSVRDLALLLAGFATMRVRDGALFRYASAAFLSKPASVFSPMDVSNIVNSYSR